MKALGALLRSLLMLSDHPPADLVDQAESFSLRESQRPYSGSPSCIDQAIKTATHVPSHTVVQRQVQTACNGNPATATDGAIYSIMCDTNYGGSATSILSGTILKSFYECLNLCEITTNCVAFDFYALAPNAQAQAGTCYLLSNIQLGYNRLQGIVAGTKVSGATPSVATSMATVTVVVTASATSTGSSVFSASPNSGNTISAASAGSAAAVTTTVTASRSDANRFVPSVDMVRGLKWLANTTFAVAVLIFAVLWI